MSIYEKLLGIQQELKVPKSQFNSFGKYNYRSCEDILTAFKPIGKKYKVVLLLNDDAEQVGDSIFIKATAKLVDVEGDHESVETTAYAMHSKEKKGMDDSQMSGTASSYARKYALNALFAIDDTKDADTDEYAKQVSKSKPANGTNLKFDVVREELDKCKTAEEITKYGEDLRKQYPKMTENQARYISMIFNQRREELKQA